MTIEYLGSKLFCQEIGAAGKIWVARSSLNSIYAVPINHTGFSLPIWSSSTRALMFLKNARLVGPRYEPHAIPLEDFATQWLSDKGKAIVELQINSEGKSPKVLIMTPDEFRVCCGFTCQ